MGLFSFLAGGSDNADILVVDDDEGLRMMLRQALQEAGYSVHTAPNGKDAIDKTKEQSYKLIFLDWEMPEMNGIECLKTIRSYRSNKKTPVMMLTGESGSQVVSKSYDLKVIDYILKPFPIQDLLARVRSTIGRA